MLHPGRDVWKTSREWAEKVRSSGWKDSMKEGGSAGGLSVGFLSSGVTRVCLKVGKLPAERDVLMKTNDQEEYLTY